MLKMRPNSFSYFSQDVQCEFFSSVEATGGKFLEPFFPHRTSFKKRVTHTLSARSPDVFVLSDQQVFALFWPKNSTGTGTVRTISQEPQAEPEQLELHFRNQNWNRTFLNEMQASPFPGGPSEPKTRPARTVPRPNRN